MSIFNTVTKPVNQFSDGRVFNVNAPSQYLLSVSNVEQGQTLEQLPNHHDINADTSADFFIEAIWNAQPIMCMRILTRVCFHDAIVFQERELEFSLEHGLSCWLDAENTYFWRRGAQVVSNG